MIPFVRRTVILGIAGITLFSSRSIMTNADITLNEVDMAGITLDLNLYASDAIANANSAADDTTDVEKDFKLNLIYDRLGIAKVDNYLNIRSGPGEDRKVIGKLPKNAGCNIYKINKDGWAKIVSGKVTGWVKAEYLITDEEAEAYAKEVATKVATVNTTTLKVRFLPSLDSKVYDLIPIDEELDVTKEYLNEDYVNRFLEKHADDEFDITEGVDLEQMMTGMDDWVCVKIDDEKAFVAKEYVDISFKLERAVAVEDLKTDGSSGVSSSRASMVEYAKQFLGNSYVWGGTSLTNGTDCSGFTMRIYEHFGYSIPRTSSAQSSYFTGINSSDAQPGDLFFYGSNGRVSHVAMYIGGGQVIHASTERTGIKISNAFYRTPLKVGRVISN
ncbi:MAG: NlpC/P60 family protein [Velocimicrobium sp.]